MKKLAFIAICGLLMMSCNQPTKQAGPAKMDASNGPVSESVRDGVFIHITQILQFYERPYYYLGLLG
jgi:hypothetical protein